MNQLVNKYKETIKAHNEEHYSTISVRTTEEIGVMIETMNIITNTATLNLFTTELSSALANYLLSDERNMQIISDALEETAKTHYKQLHDMIHGSCIEILENQGALKIKGLANEFIPPWEWK